MITKIWNGRAGQVVFDFSNGNTVSILWAWGSYSDNHMSLDGGYDMEKIMKRNNWESTRVEVYSMGTDTNGFTKWLERKYGDNPAGYVPVNDIPAILKRADRG
jgi:hypothetical protein